MDISGIQILKEETELCKIMKTNRSDKAGPRHTYTKVYFPLFTPVRSNSIRVFELGLGSTNQKIPSNMGPQGRPCASLYAWRDFFPHAEIYGADIDPLLLRTEHRLKTFYCDQLNKESIQNLWGNAELQEPFEIIIEDGIHTFNGSVLFFEESVHKLAPKGVYIIEDIHKRYLNELKQKVLEWVVQYPNFEFMWVENTIPQNTEDNTLLLIQRTK